MVTQSVTKVEATRTIPKSLSVHSKAVLNIANENETAREALHWMAVRERSFDKIEIPRFKQQLLNRGVKVVDEHLIGMFQKLDSLGIGALIFGRKGNPDRFELHFTMRDIGSLSYSDASVLAPKLQALSDEKAKRNAYLAARKKNPTPIKKRPGRKPKAKSEDVVVTLANKTLYIHLAKNRAIEIVVPSDLNSEEARIISDALKSVPKSA